MSDDSQQPQDETPNAAKAESRRVARRYFIRAALYAAPAVASVVAVQHASATVSDCLSRGCTGANCIPGGPCQDCFGQTC